ncbi:SurA N-terminal domain-containing protein [Flocculibacter collagenilyticus]|uniref:SurA N-terminal domain-containing protein n=1 Tax=Flocculibacter collagenilyticus TaxID=2744479 RepID=UPI0018F312A2|nr:SurA N-terminal domain-containing protein [Flocculibacter collagenilyticus]
MLERIREGSQGVAAKIVLGFVIITFALAGIGSYLGQSSDVPVAIVNGENINQAQFEQAYQNERARMEQQFGQMFSQLAADESYMEKFRQGVVDRLINDLLQDQAAKELGLRVSDEAIKESIVKMPEFQLDGKFDNDRYLAVLRQAGFQPSAFRDYLRTEMTRRQLGQAVAVTSFALEGEVKAQEALAQQVRHVEYATIDANQFKDAVTPTEEALQEHYQMNSTQFETDEQVKVEYVELNAADIAKNIEVSDEEVQQYYEENLANYKTEKKVRASHILIEFGDDEDAARKEIEAIQDELKSGADFAELAKAKSQDTFSGEQGGDLDWFEKGIMDPAFDEAVFELSEVGDYSDIVKSEFGFHIIKLTDVNDSETTELAEVKDKIAAELKQAQATEQFYDLQQQLSELSFEVPDTLEDAAVAINADVKETAFFSKNTAPAALSNPKVINAAFSEQVVQENLNSDVIELSDEHVIVLRMVGHKPARTKSFDEVKEEVTAAVVQQMANEKASELADSIIASVKSGSELETAVTTHNLTLEKVEALTRQDNAVNYDIKQKAFSLPHPSAEVKSIEKIELASGGVAVVNVVEVKDGEIAEDLTAAEQRLASVNAQADYKTFIEQLRAKAEIEKPINN